jgi:hypothetical protein
MNLAPTIGYIAGAVSAIALMATFLIFAKRINTRL